MAGGVQGGQHAWQGACMAGGLCGRGSVWQGGVFHAPTPMPNTMRYGQ